MHFKTLVTVDIPELEPNHIVDEFIEKKIDAVKCELEKSKKKKYMMELGLGQLNCLRTEFARCVMTLM